VILHGLGSSILKCVKIALIIKSYYTDIDFEIETSSEPTIVDIEIEEVKKKINKILKV